MNQLISISIRPGCIEGQFDILLGLRKTMYSVSTGSLSDLVAKPVIILLYTPERQFEAFQVQLYIFVWSQPYTRAY